MQPNTQNSLATVTGGLILKAKFQDGHEEEIRIRQVPIREFDKYLSCLDDECGLIEYLCGKPTGFAETLTQESFVEIVTEGEKLNSTDFFAQWVQRKNCRVDMLAPGMREKAMRLRLNNG